MVELLLARGANPAAKNRSGATPAEAAEKNGFPETAKLLRKKP
jgi:ankyrin repeat protein